MAEAMAECTDDVLSGAISSLLLHIAEQFTLAVHRLPNVLVYGLILCSNARWLAAHAVQLAAHHAVHCLQTW